MLTCTQPYFSVMLPATDRHCRCSSSSAVSHIFIVRKICPQPYLWWKQWRIKSPCFQLITMVKKSRLTKWSKYLLQKGRLFQEGCFSIRAHAVFCQFSVNATLLAKVVLWVFLRPRMLGTKLTQLGKREQKNSW